MHPLAWHLFVMHVLNWNIGLSFDHLRILVSYASQFWIALTLLQWHCDRSVFWALFGAIYLCFGMPEVYRVLFEVFGMDPEAEECQPRLRRQLEDVDYVSVEFEGNKLSWQDVATYKARPFFSFLSLLSFCFAPFIFIDWLIDSLPMRLALIHFSLVPFTSCILRSLTLEFEKESSIWLLNRRFYLCSGNEYFHSCLTASRRCSFFAS